MIDSTIFSIIEDKIRLAHSYEYGAKTKIIYLGDKAQLRLERKFPKRLTFNPSQTSQK
jgi:hypothetical protein